MKNDDLDILFNNARSQNGWLDKNVTDEQIEQIFELQKFAPTSANCCPARFVFVRSDEAKNRLKKHLSEGNIEKSMTAPVVVIIAYDLKFYEHLPFLFPHTDAKSWYAGKPDKITAAAQLNATLQGGYLLLAARAIGLDCGPMGGFDNETLDTDFFPDGELKSLFLCGLGYGDSSKVFARSPRFNFADVCQVI